MQFLKKIPLFPWLLALFFCLHGSLENYGYVGVGEILKIGIWLLAGISLFVVLLYLFIRKMDITALLAFFIAGWYLFFGAFHDWVKSVSWLMLLHAYTYFLPFLLLLTVGWAVFIIRKKNIRPRLIFYFNLLLLLYCCLDAVLIAGKSFSAKKDHQNTSFNYPAVKATPNVYYLLFDEYPGYKSLKDSFDFANDQFYDYLHQRQFRFLPVSANYNFTLFSMSSVFNMKYVDSNYNPMKLTVHDYQLRNSEIRYGAVFRIFSEMGYTLHNFSVFDVLDKPALSADNGFMQAHSQLLTDKILHNRIMRTSGWLFMNLFPSWQRSYALQQDRANGLAAEEVLKLANEKPAGPQFCYAHFMMPHAPLFRDSTGNYNSDAIIRDGDAQSNRPLYLSYIKYVNTVIESLADSITKKDPGAIVAIMSDHGYRSYRQATGFPPYQFNNICAARFPDNNFPDMPERWTTVNFFRYLFNSQFGQSMPFLPDKTIGLNY